MGKYKDYKIQLRSGNTKIIRGKKVFVANHISTFIHSGTITNWIVSEEETGAILTAGRTQKEAIEQAKIVLKGIKKVTLKKRIQQLKI